MTQDHPPNKASQDRYPCNSRRRGEKTHHAICGLSATWIHHLIEQIPCLASNWRQERFMKNPLGTTSDFNNPEELLAVVDEHDQDGAATGAEAHRCGQLKAHAPCIVLKVPARTATLLFSNAARKKTPYPFTGNAWEAILPRESVTMSGCTGGGGVKLGIRVGACLRIGKASRPSRYWSRNLSKSIERRVTPPLPQTLQRSWLWMSYPFPDLVEEAFPKITDVAFRQSSSPLSRRLG